MNADERFWLGVEKTDTCWLWRKRIDGGGYGRFSCGGRYVSAHRWSYERLIGPIPFGLHLDHLCRTRACVNPAHLEPVTLRENNLRGNGLGGTNARKTMCSRGHPLTPDNLVRCDLAKYGVRKCRTCDNARHSRRYWAKKSVEILRSRSLSEEGK